MAGEIGPAAGDADAVAALGQRPHEMTADEARPAEHGNELGRLEDLGHDVLRNRIGARAFRAS